MVDNLSYIFAEISKVSVVVKAKVIFISLTIGLQVFLEASLIVCPKEKSSELIETDILLYLLNIMNIL